MRTPGRAAVLLGVLALTSVPTPVMGQPWQIFAADAQRRGAMFTVESAPGCTAWWTGARNAERRTAFLMLECPGATSEVTARFRLFDRYGLMPPWRVGRFEVNGPTGQVRVVQAPQEGGTELATEVELTARPGGRRVNASVHLTASAPATRPSPVPNCGGTGGGAYSCVADSDCASGFSCSQTCGGICLRAGRPAPADVPAAPQVIDFSTVDALSDLRFETGLPHACEARTGPPRNASETSVLSLDCSLRPWSARTRFDLFDRLNLHPAWVVDSATASLIDAGPRSFFTVVRLPAAGQRSLATQVRLRAYRNEMVSVSLRVVARPLPPAIAFGDPLPFCIRPPAAVVVPESCQADDDCGPTPSNRLTCRAECGNSCVVR